MTIVFIAIGLFSIALVLFGLWFWRRDGRWLTPSAASPAPPLSDISSAEETPASANPVRADEIRTSTALARREAISADSAEPDEICGVADADSGTSFPPAEPEAGASGEDEIAPKLVAASDPPLPTTAMPPPADDWTEADHHSGDREGHSHVVPAAMPEAAGAPELLEIENELAAADGLATDSPTPDGDRPALQHPSPPEEATADCDEAPADQETGSSADDASAEESSPPKPAQRAAYRDRRGKARSAKQPESPTAGERPRDTAPSPAELRLRLLLHPANKTAVLSAVMSRPDGYPDRITVELEGGGAVEAYNSQRYDDCDLSWTSELLSGELRINSAEGLQWLRSARRLHIFTEDPNGPGFISVGAASAGGAHAIACRSEDAPSIEAAAASTGSPALITHERWHGVPADWLILSGYTPRHAAATDLPAALRTLDPGASTEIVFSGGLPVASKAFAQGHPPRIEVGGLPADATVSIDGERAIQGEDGAWTVPGWDCPGSHLVDVVPGPSLGYEILPDPASTDGWQFWNANADRFSAAVRTPWSRAEICGAMARGPEGQTVVAAETQPTLVALGYRSVAAPLAKRPDLPVSVALLAEPPAFLVSAAGQRRSQGCVIWLAPNSAAPRGVPPDFEWAAIVHAASSRRLPLKGADFSGELAWQKAKDRARRIRRRRS